MKIDTKFKHVLLQKDPISLVLYIYTPCLRKK